jgi:hypothetical protein
MKASGLRVLPPRHFAHWHAVNVCLCHQPLACRSVADSQLRHLNEDQAKPGAGRNRHPGAARPAPLGTVPHSCRRSAWHHLDSRRVGSDACGRRRRRTQGKPNLNLTNAEVGLASSFYLAGAVLGVLLFGWLTDRLGRKRLFFITLTVYLLATTATAFS